MLANHSMLAWKNPGDPLNPIDAAVKHSCPLCSVTKAVFHLSSFLMCCWTKLLVMSNAEKTVEPLSAEECRPASARDKCWELNVYWHHADQWHLTTLFLACQQALFYLRSLMRRATWRVSRSLFKRSAFWKLLVLTSDQLTLLYYHWLLCLT